MTYRWFELRKGFAGPFTSILQAQFMFLFWIKPRVDRHKVLWIIVAPLVLLFLVQDFLYQVIVATFVFMEWPRDLLFTGRIKRLDKVGDWRAERFKNVLNEIDPGHV